MRCSILPCLILLLAALPARAASSPSLAGKRPNIILVMTDDQGYADLECHGNPVLKTPHLNRLHRESTRFREFHVSPTCAPTRSALLTGRHEFFNGVTHTIQERERLTLQAITLPEILRGTGYTTGIFGKWHLGDEDAYQPGKRGFDEAYIHGAGGIGQSFPGSCGDAPGNRYFDPVVRHNGRFVKTRGYCTDLFFSQARRWISEVKDADKPFFVFLTPNAPHDPLDCPPGSAEPYRGKVPEKVAKFYGMIANIDHNMGTLLDDLARWNLDRNTLVIFMTDNGSATGSGVHNAGMRGAKGTPFRGGTRVPSFWRWKSVLGEGRDVEPLTCHWDVLPTLAELAGATLSDKARRQVQGRSLLPLLQDPRATWSNRLFVTHVGRWPTGKAAQHARHNACIRDERWSLLLLPGGKRELYDLNADPGQKRDVLANHPEPARQLTEAFDDWWRRVSPELVNEDARGPRINPFKEAYWRQYRGPGPNNVAPPADFAFDPAPGGGS
ncbi:MAG: arylsulfatase [Gemmataceae bacterium]